uniref:hypothetical protein n=1 Tax=Candidatus Electronema sp. TaxID=2698783 RepID=UPI004056AAB3
MRGVFSQLRPVIRQHNRKSRPAFGRGSPGDDSCRYIALDVVKLMLRKRIHVADSRILVLGLTFRENCSAMSSMCWKWAWRMGVCEPV